jgi:hypothetical protein
MRDTDFDWAAALMSRRRQEYVEFSPIFWRPAEGVDEAHAGFLRAAASRPGAVALRTEGAFALSTPSDGRCLVDDFAVETPDLWSSEGQDVLLAAWAAARSDEQRRLRVVTARRDEPKRQMLAGLGLTVAARWWVKELRSAGEAVSWGPVSLDGHDALIMPPPPVYDPGGAVCLLGNIASDRAGRAAEAAAAHGAVLAIVQRDQADFPVSESDRALEAAGFHNPSEFYEGEPTGRTPRERGES